MKSSSHATAVGSLRSRVIPRLLALTARKPGDTPFQKGGPQLARVVALGPLHLDDVGAHVREDLGGHRPRQVLRDLDDANALEREHRRGAHAFAAAIASSMTGSKRWPSPSRTTRPGCGKWAGSTRSPEAAWRSTKALRVTAACLAS